MQKPRIIDYNKTYYNIQNKAFKIIKEVEPTTNITGRLVRRVLIKFESGYETITYLSKIKEGKLTQVIDYLSPTVLGIGIIGYAEPKENEPMYKRWYAMLSRCYNPDDKNYKNYGAKGVYVSERWLRFDYFLEDIVNLSGYEAMINNPHIKYQLDKDVLQQGYEIKVYSPDTCIWVPQVNNVLQRIIDNKETYNNKYYGVQLTKYGTYECRITHNGESASNTYCNEKIAASMYNYRAITLGRPALNDVPYISPQECAKYLTRPIVMCTIVQQPALFPLKEMCTIVN